MHFSLYIYIYKIKNLKNTQTDWSSESHNIAYILYQICQYNTRNNERNKRDAINL